MSAEPLEHDLRGCNTKITKGPGKFICKLSIVMLIDNVMAFIAVVGVLSDQLIMAIREGNGRGGVRSGILQ